MLTYDAFYSILLSDDFGRACLQDSTSGVLHCGGKNVLQETEGLLTLTHTAQQDEPISCEANPEGLALHRTTCGR